LFEAADRLAALPEPPLTEREVEVEVQAARGLLTVVKGIADTGVFLRRK